MIAPIQVHGNDLKATLDQLKREGKYAWAMDVLDNAEYKLHINFERDLGCHAPVVGKSSEVPGLKPSGVTIAATITNEKHDFSGEAGSTPARSVNPRKAAVHDQPKNVAGPLVDVEHTGNSLYGSTSNTDMDSQMGGKLATSQPVNAGDLPSKSTCRLEHEGGTGFNKGVAPLRATPTQISIEARMATLRESLVAKGKLRPRREARRPYAN